MATARKPKDKNKEESKTETAKANTLTREIVFKDYRNLGIDKEQTLVINKRTDGKNLGELIIVIGGNNTGKSNVLDGICALKNGIDIDRDEPDFKYLDNNPEVKLVIRSRNNRWTYAAKADATTIYDGNMKVQKVQVFPPKPEYTMSQELKEYLTRNNLTNVITRMNEGKKIDDKLLASIGVQINAYAHDSRYGFNQVGAVSQRLIDELDDYNIATKQYEDDLVESENYDDVIDEYNQKTFEAVGCPLLPNIVKYKEKQISQKEFVASIKNLSGSAFFIKLFALLDIKAEEISVCVDRVNSNKVGAGATRKLENELNAKLEKFTKQFNKMYVFDGNEYKFEFLLDSEKLSFSIAYGDKIPLNIDKQSTGFRWFFNFYINLLNDKKLGNGDIVIMDEPATNLHVRGIAELREFLKEYAKQSGISFILSTHSPFFIDVDFLDELRIVKREGENAVICNDFSLEKDETRDTLFDVLSSLTVARHVVLNPNDPLVFVEGVTDYNYLVAFKRYLNKEREEFCINFLPVNGLKDKNLIDKLCSIVKSPTLLVDNDEAGTIVERKNKRSGDKINIISLSEISDKIKTIEDMFAGKDRGYVDEKYNAQSRLFKSNFEEIAKNLSKETRDNFLELFQRLKNCNA